MGASVKIMLSHDYCHFEVALSSDAAVTPVQVNVMRKKAQFLADEAVRQYKLAKERETARIFDRSSEIYEYDDDKIVDDLPF